MEVKCVIDSTRTVKDGLKITLALDKKQKAEFLKHQANFDDKPLKVDFQIDAVEQKIRLTIISPEQRRKIFALCNDIASQTGDNTESVRENLKIVFLQAYPQHEDFSLSNCKSELAGDFITFLVSWCFMNGVYLTEHPRELIEDTEIYLYLCLKFGICAICGKPGETHHWDAIGMGRDRRHYDDSEHRKIQLCREHHSEAEQIGRDTFAEKYHVFGVKYVA